jgi:hypothetical protein
VEVDVNLFKLLLVANFAVIGQSAYAECESGNYTANLSYNEVTVLAGKIRIRFDGTQGNMWDAGSPGVKTSIRIRSNVSGLNGTFGYRDWGPYKGPQHDLVQAIDTNVCPGREVKGSCTVFLGESSHLSCQVSIF